MIEHRPWRLVADHEDEIDALIAAAHHVGWGDFVRALPRSKKMLQYSANMANPNILSWQKFIADMMQLGLVVAVRK